MSMIYPLLFGYEPETRTCKKLGIMLDTVNGSELMKIGEDQTYTKSDLYHYNCALFANG